MTLLPCPHCQRHVRSTEEACPFCDGTLAVPSRVSKLARAAVIASAGLMTAGCSSSDKKPTNVTDPIAQSDAGMSEPDDTTPPDTTPPADAAPADPIIHDRRVDPKPYGAPPNRIRRA